MLVLHTSFVLLPAFFCSFSCCKQTNKAVTHLPLPQLKAVVDANCLCALAAQLHVNLLHQCLILFVSKL